MSEHSRIAHLRSALQLPAVWVLLTLLGLTIVGWVWLDSIALEFAQRLQGVVVVHQVLSAVLRCGKFEWQLCALLLVYAYAIWRQNLALRRALHLCLLALVVSGLAALLLKQAIPRPRPDADLSVYKLSGWRRYTSGDLASFPSGDAATAFALAWMIATLWRRLRGPALTVATLVAFSRLYKLTHFASDVTAGALLGVAVAALILGRFARREAADDETAPGGTL